MRAFVRSPYLASGIDVTLFGCSSFCEQLKATKRFAEQHRARTHRAGHRSEWKWIGDNCSPISELAFWTDLRDFW